MSIRLPETGDPPSWVLPRSVAWNRMTASGIAQTESGEVSAGRVYNIPVKDGADAAQRYFQIRASQELTQLAPIVAANQSISHAQPIGLPISPDDVGGPEGPIPNRPMLQDTEALPTLQGGPAPPETTQLVTVPNPASPAERVPQPSNIAPAQPVPASNVEAMQQLGILPGGNPQAQQSQPAEVLEGDLNPMAAALLAPPGSTVAVTTTNDPGATLDVSGIPTTADVTTKTTTLNLRGQTQPIITTTAVITVNSPHPNFGGTAWKAQVDTNRAITHLDITGAKFAGLDFGPDGKPSSVTLADRSVFALNNQGKFNGKFAIPAEGLSGTTEPLPGGGFRAKLESGETIDFNAAGKIVDRKAAPDTRSNSEKVVDFFGHSAHSFESWLSDLGAGLNLAPTVNAAARPFDPAAQAAAYQNTNRIVDAQNTALHSVIDPFVRVIGGFGHTVAAGLGGAAATAAGGSLTPEGQALGQAAAAELAKAPTPEQTAIDLAILVLPEMGFAAGRFIGAEIAATRVAAGLVPHVERLATTAGREAEDAIRQLPGMHPKIGPFRTPIELRGPSTPNLGSHEPLGKTFDSSTMPKFDELRVPGSHEFADGAAHVGIPAAVEDAIAVMRIAAPSSREAGEAALQAVEIRSAVTKWVAEKSAGKFSLTYSTEEMNQIVHIGTTLGLDKATLIDMIKIGSREAKAIPASSLVIQMDRWANEIQFRGYPYKFSSRSDFDQFSLDLLGALRNSGIPAERVYVQGSSLRTPFANDVDLAVFVEQHEFDGMLTTYFDGKAALKSPRSPLTLTGLSNAQLVELAWVIYLNRSLYNSEAKTFSNAVRNGIIGSKTKISPDLKMISKATQQNYPHLNVESISILVRQGEFDTRPALHVK